MADATSETMECPACGGDGYVACDDGSETQCERCDGTGVVTLDGGSGPGGDGDAIAAG